MLVRSNNKNLSIVISISIKIDAIARKRIAFVIIDIDDVELDKNAFTLVDTFIIINDVSIVVVDAFLAIATTSLRSIERSFFHIRSF